MNNPFGIVYGMSDLEDQYVMTGYDPESIRLQNLYLQKYGLPYPHAHIPGIPAIPVQNAIACTYPVPYPGTLTPYATNPYPSGPVSSAQEIEASNRLKQLEKQQKEMEKKKCELENEINQKKKQLHNEQVQRQRNLEKHQRELDMMKRNVQKKEHDLKEAKRRNLKENEIRKPDIVGTQRKNQHSSAISTTQRNSDSVQKSNKPSLIFLQGKYMYLHGDGNYYETRP